MTPNANMSSPTSSGDSPPANLLTPAPESPEDDTDEEVEHPDFNKNNEEKAACHIAIDSTYTCKIHRQERRQRELVKATSLRGGEGMQEANSYDVQRGRLSQFKSKSQCEGWRKRVSWALFLR